MRVRQRLPLRKNCSNGMPKIWMPTGAVEIPTHHHPKRYAPAGQSTAIAHHQIRMVPQMQGGAWAWQTIRAKKAHAPQPAWSRQTVPMNLLPTRHHQLARPSRSHPIGCCCPPKSDPYQHSHLGNGIWTGALLTRQGRFCKYGAVHWHRAAPRQSTPQAKRQEGMEDWACNMPPRG